MNEIKVFENSEFGTVRTDIDENGKVLFCAKDVATALGYTNASKAINDHCRWVTKRYVPHPQSPDKEIEMSFIPEGDVYRLIVSSKLPTAEKFERWVFDEVLPDIRQHGMYMTGEKLVDMMADPDKALEMLIDYAKERKERLRLEQVVKEQMPKVEFANAISTTPDGILVKQMAHLLTQNGFTTGQNRLFEQLRSDGFLCSVKGTRFNVPTQKAIEQGLMATRESHYDDNNDVTHLSFTPLITAKGQKFFLRKYANKILSDEEIQSILEEAI